MNVSLASVERPRIVITASYEARRRRGETPADAAARCRARVRTDVGYLLTSDRHDRREERALFAATAAPLPTWDRSAAVAVIEGAYGRVAAYHRLALSPHPSLGLAAAGELQDWTQATMVGIEGWRCGAWTWVAAVHTDTHPHVHAIVAGRDQAGRDVRLTTALFARMKVIGQGEAERLLATRAARADRIYQMGV